jgi:hypothetical protein
METTFDKFINNDVKEREQFDREYEAFLLSELALEKVEQENISEKTLVRKSAVPVHG